MGQIELLAIMAAIIYGAGKADVNDSIAKAGEILHQVKEAVQGKKLG